MLKDKVIRKANKQAIFCAVLIFVISGLLLIPLYAEDGYDEVDTVIGAIPEEAAKYMPQELLSGDVEIAARYDASVLIRCAAEIALSLLGPILSDLALVLGAVVLSSVVKRISDAAESESLSVACGYVSSLCIALPLINTVSSLWDEMAASLDRLTLFMNALLPVMSSLYAAGGNYTAAMANNASMAVIFAAIENICAYCLYPVLRICFGISLLSCVGGGVDLSGISSFIRGAFTTGLSFIMVLFTLVMSYQNRLALSADGAAARTVKFAVSNLIPVVGGAAGEAMRAVIGSIGTVKNAAGFIAVVAIVLIVLPIIVSILLHRLSLRMASVAAQILGCDREKVMIDEMYGMTGYALAITSACSIMFIFNVTLLVKSAVAVTV